MVARPFVPRHKPGRVHPSARSATNGVPKLDRLVASGVQNDPLSANPTLLKLNQIGFVVPTTGSAFPPIATGVASATSSSYQLVSSSSSGGQSIPFLTGSAAAGDVNGDGQDDLIYAVGDPNNRACLAYRVQSFSTTLSYGPSATTSCELLWANEGTGNVQLATGFFFSPPFTSTTPVAQLATALVLSNNDLCLRLWTPTALGSLNLQWMEHTCPINLVEPPKKHPASPGFSLAVGDFDGNGQDELAVGWIDHNGSVYLAKYQATPTGALQEIARNQIFFYDPSGTWRVTPLGGNISLAAGDFDGDGRDELAVALFGWGPNLVFGNEFNFIWTQLAVFRATGGTFTLVARWNDPYTATAGAGYGKCLKKWGPNVVRAVAGRYRMAPTPTDQVVIVAPYLTADACNISGMFSVDFYVYGLSFQSNFQVDQPLVQPLFFSIPFNEKNDDIVEAILSLTSGATYAPIEPAPRRGASAVSLALEQVTYLLQSADPHYPAQSAVLDFAPDWSSVSIGNVLRQFPSTIGPTTQGVALVAGDFAGRSLRLGAPIVAVDQQMLSEVDGILYAPPTHFDQFPEIGPSATITVNINWNTSNCIQGYDNCTRTNYNTTTVSSTQQSTQVQRSWSIGAGPPEIESNVQAGLTLSYGQNFDKTTTSFASSSFGTTSRATTDDIVMFRAIEYTIWQYPVYLHNILQGYLAVVWPTAESCDQTSCQPVQQAEIASGLDTWFYRPNHDPSNVFSYQPIGPSAIVTQLLQPQYLGQVATGQSQGWMINNETTVTTDTVKTQNFNLNFSGSFLGEIAALGKQLGLSLDASFSNTTIKGSQRTFDQTTSLIGYLEDLADEDWSYNVGPSAGWTSEGYFEVAYSATPGTLPGASNWILPQYYGTTKPDFTFTLKNRVNQTLYPQQFYTTDLLLDPACPLPGQPLTLTARVRNYSIVGWNAPVEVSFYNGDPTRGGTPIGSTSIVSITPQGVAPATFVWTAPAPGSYDIWAVIDPANHIPEIHKANNRGWFQLPVASTVAADRRDDPPTHLRGLHFGTVDVCGAAPGRPTGDLAISASTLAARNVPTSAIGGRALITLTARVSATGASFANVPVAFYDGDPHKGGRRIGHHILPMVHEGKSSTATVVWDATGQRGRHTIYAVVWRNAAAERNHKNNIAFLTIDLPEAPYRAYLGWTADHSMLDGPRAINIRPTRAVRRRRSPLCGWSQN